MLMAHQMNRSDGGRNRPNMDHVGLAGLDRVLAAMGRNTQGLNIEECRQMLWECSVVRSQLNEIEVACRRHGVVVLYQPKSPPKFNWCEVRAPAI